MKLPGLIELGLILILVSYSKGQSWEVNVTHTINATRGSTVNIPCRFAYPRKYNIEDLEVYWKKDELSKIKFKDNDKNAYVFHPNETFVHENYKGKTKLIGNITMGNCSLEIQNIMEDGLKIYLRVIEKDNVWSFSQESVSMHVFEPPEILPMYMAIFVPVAALLIIIFITGIVFYTKHKRSQSFTREESGYYANFNTASSNQAKREAFSKKQDNNKLPEPKAIDEPIYINVKAPPGQMDQSMDQSMDSTDIIYANVDYEK